MPNPNTEIVKQRLEASRKNLLDTSLRNKLINHRKSRITGIEVTGEDPAEVFRILVLEGKSMTFIGKPDRPTIEEIQSKLPVFDAPEAVGSNPEHRPENQGHNESDTSLQVDQLDTKLNTNETTTALYNRLLRTWRDAQSSLEEQGVNVLFLALGILEWYESESSQELRKAPLILVPVLIERSRGNQFRIRYEGTEIGENLSLAAKLRQEFHIELQELPEAENLDVRAYFAQAKQAVASQKRWRVDERALTLSFFSYAKYLMYKDLEGTPWPEQLKPWSHDILKALLDCGFDDKEAGISEDENLDRYRSVAEANEVYDADSSQLFAILEAKSGRSMIIEGPPGTGKSQTITNLIAEAIGEGKKVLFVAEKRAALDVVWQRLKDAGLHEACLELHSNKSNKREFYSKLEEAVRLGRPRAEEMQVQVQKLGELHDRLNEYCEAVNCALPHRNITPVVAMGRLLALGEEPEDLRKPDFSIMQDWSQADFEQRLDFVQKTQSKVAEIGTPLQHPFFGSGLRLLLPDDKNKIVLQIKVAIESVQNARDSAQKLAERLELPPSENLNKACAICRAAQRAADAPALEGIQVNTDKWESNADRLHAAISAGHRFTQIRASYHNLLKPEAWSAAIEEDRRNIAQYGAKWWRFLIGKYRASIQSIRSLCAAELPSSQAERLALVDAILESQAKQRDIAQAELLCKEMFSIQWQGEQSNWQALSIILEWILDLHARVGAGELPPGITKFLEGRHSSEGLAEEASRVTEDCASCEARISKLLSSLKAEGELLTMASHRFSNQLSKLNEWVENILRLQEIVTFNLLCDEAKEQGIKSVTDLAASWETAGERLVEAFKRAWYNGVLREAFQSRPTLARFDRASHEAAINSFCDLDRLMLSYNRAKVALRHWAGVAPTRESSLGSLGLLQKEFAKRARHKPIRKIMSEAGEAVQAIKPVFMMSPLSVAMYLPPDGPRFDIVIFDEASQIKPEDAFSAIIRARQVIVVGDSKQMPPTSFFDKLTQVDDSDDEDEEVEINVTGKMESILKLMDSSIAARSPRRRDLRWHYRSKHDSLISVSNKLFYNHRLFVFPNADRERKDLGLVFHYLPNTVYGRGGSRKNQDEARIVAEAVVHHARENPKLSLAVVAFSAAQQEAVEDELRRLSANDPAIRAVVDEFTQAHSIQRLVKNLEMIQGDERDVIFISIGYGRDANGYISMNFGPLSKEGGERRLNVLITRARYRCEVFTNMRSSDIRIGETRAAGVHALREYLHFAETGELDQPTATGRAPDSDFEIAVIEAIRAHGYKVVPQVGSAGFFIDIGVCDPNNPERFVLGIECDGAQYHRARSARDRDRLRQEVLEQRGWRIHRIWSTDWWRNPEQELRRTLQAIEQAIAVKVATLPTGSSPLPSKELIRDEQSPGSAMEFNHIYAFARLNITLWGIELRNVGSDQMAEWIQQVVEVESPVHFEEVVRRIREAAGLERAGNAIREAVLRGLQHAVRQRRIIFQDSFLWKMPIQPPAIRDRSMFPNNLKKFDFVHSEEIEAAIKKVVGQSFGISRDEAVTASLRLLGFERTTEVMRERTGQLITKLASNGSLREQGERLQLPAS